MMTTLLRVAVLAGLLAAHDGGHPASAQAYSIETEPFLHIDARVESPLPIHLGPAGLPKQAMVLVHGLNSAFSLTRGRLFESGVWAVGVSDLPDLQVMASSRAAGSQLPLTVSLVALDGAVLAKAALTLVVREPAGGVETSATTAPLAAPAQASGTPRKARPTPNAAAEPSLALVAPGPAREAPTPAPRISPREEAERLKSAEEALALDDVGGARLILEYLARRGSAEGAYRLARSHDPELARARGNQALAAQWYAKAAELGHAAARGKTGAR